MSKWPKTRLGRFMYDAATIFVAALGLYLVLGGGFAILVLIIGVQYILYCAIFGKPDKL